MTSFYHEKLLGRRVVAVNGAKVDGVVRGAWISRDHAQIGYVRLLIESRYHEVLIDAAQPEVPNACMLYEAWAHDVVLAN